MFVREVWLSAYYLQEVKLLFSIIPCFCIFSSKSRVVLVTHGWMFVQSGALTERPPTERPPTERPPNIFTLTERPPNGMSTWTLRPLVSLTPIHNVHQHYVHPPFRVDDMLLVTSCPPSAILVETCCPSVTKPAQNCAILSLQQRRGVGSCQFLKHRAPNTPLLGQLVPVMLFELGHNYFSVDTNLYVELDQED